MSLQRRFTVRSHSVLKTTMAVLVVVYVVIAYEGGHTERHQYFPAFNWSLFSYVNATPSLVELHVKRIGDQTFDPPVNYFELGSYFLSARNHSTQLTKNVGLLAWASQNGDKQRAETLRKLIELQDLSGHGIVEYQLVRVEFNPIERWKTGRKQHETVLAEYQTGNGK